MPIIRKLPLLDSEARNIRSVHRWGILFGLITPMALLLLSLLQSRDVLALWPSLFSFAYEHAYYYGWAGMYAFGLLALLWPEISDTEVRERDTHVLHTALALYGVGVLGGLAHSVAAFYGISGLGHPMAALLAALIQASGWIVLMYQICVWYKRDMRRYSMHEWLQIAGLILLAGGAMVYAAVRVWMLLVEARIVPLHLVQCLRVLPVAGAGMVTIGFLLRMMPELLGWRPLPDSLLKKIIAGLLVSVLLGICTVTAFHESFALVPGILYLVGAGGLLLSVAALVVFMDVLRIRLAPPVNHEHVMYVYGSLAWALISAGMLFVSVLWEVLNKQALHQHWTEALLMAFLAGFVGLGLMGLYTYWINQMPNAHPHKDTLIVIAFVLWNWSLTLRVFIHPLATASGWAGAHVFRLVLDILLGVSLFLVSLDMYDGLIGHRLCLRKSCRR